MKKYIMLILLILFASLAVSCNVDDIQISENIAAPENILSPISGTWLIEDYKISSTSTMDEEMAKSYIGREALFDKKMVSITDNYCFEPSYKIKNVNTKDYLIYQYKVSPEFLNIGKDEIQIVSIIGQEQFYYEFIKVSENAIIMNIEGVFFYLNKTSDKVEDEIIAEYYYTDNAMFRMANIKEEDILRTGVLIGLKSLNLENREEGMESWDYRTLFIRSQNRQIVGIYEMEDIFVPRMTGFWKIGVVRKELDSVSNDVIVTQSVKKTVDLKNKEKRIEKDRNIKGKTIEENSLKNILYAGNDYISIEKFDYMNKGQRYLEFYPIDNIDGEKPMKFSDAVGEVGKTSFLEGANKEILSTDKKYNNSTIDLTPDEENFGIFRRNGHWVFKGRINYVEDGKYSYKNFDIKTIPPKEIVHYDELSVPWNAIKLKLPEATDAFISPNEDIIIVMERNNMLIYLIDNGEIGDIPIAKIRLKNTEKVIMSEWATGRYPILWEEEFLNNEAVLVEYN